LAQGVLSQAAPSAVAMLAALSALFLVSATDVIHDKVEVEARKSEGMREVQRSGTGTDVPAGCACVRAASGACGPTSECAAAALVCTAYELNLDRACDAPFDRDSIGASSGSPFNGVSGHFNLTADSRWGNCIDLDGWQSVAGEACSAVGCSFSADPPSDIHTKVDRYGVSAAMACCACGRGAFNSPSHPDRVLHVEQGIEELTGGKHEDATTNQDAGSYDQVNHVLGLTKSIAQTVENNADAQPFTVDDPDTHRNKKF